MSANDRADLNELNSAGPAGAQTAGRAPGMVKVALTVLITYALAYLAQMFLTPKIDPLADSLAFAGTEVLMLHRGYELLKDPKDCSSRKCLDGVSEGMPYSAALDRARVKIISASAGKRSCSMAALEFLWRDACIDLFVRSDALSPDEFDLLRRFINQPCASAGTPSIARRLRRLECKEGKASKERRATVTIYSQKNKVSHIETWLIQ